MSWLFSHEIGMNVIIESLIKEALWKQKNAASVSNFSSCLISTSAQEQALITPHAKCVREGWQRTGMSGIEKKQRVNIKSGESETKMLLRVIELRTGENTISRRLFVNTGLTLSGLITGCLNSQVSAIAAAQLSSGEINKQRRMLIIATIRKQLEEYCAIAAIALSGFAKTMQACFHGWRGI